MPVSVRLEGEVTGPDGGVVSTFDVSAKEAGMAMGGWNYRVFSFKYCATLLTTSIGKSISEIIKLSMSQEFGE